MPPRKRARKSRYIKEDVAPVCRADEATPEAEEQGHAGSTSDTGDNAESSDTASSRVTTTKKEYDDEMAHDTSQGSSGPETSRALGGGSTQRAGPGYNALKTYNGQVYSGMEIGGSHTWNYDQGVWKETKEEPDLWKIDYQTTKRRARSAPKGSGAPVGTEYHWLVVAHQYVKKVDANTYETRLSGSKYKLAHKSVPSTSWSVPTVKGQRDREIELLEDAKRRVQGLPPVLASEKVKVEKHEKGQQKLDTLFAKARQSAAGQSGEKRKRDDI